MDNLNLSSDEAIIHTTQIIIINGVRHEAVLTSRRLILVESETGQIHEDILFADIVLAKSGVNKLREPIITISFNSPEGENRTLNLIFIHGTGSQNSRDIEKCLTYLKQQAVPVENKSLVSDAVRLDRGERANTGVLAVDEKTRRPAVPEWSFTGAPQQIKQPIKEEEVPERSPLFLIGVMVLVIGVIISGMFIVGQVIHAKNVPVSQNETEPVVTTIVTTTPDIVPAPEPVSEVTSVPEESSPSIAIPPNGIWVRVEYPGNFSGSIGARGRNIEVSGSGIKYYQLPVTDTNIDGSVAKLDGSSDKMVVEVYKDGTLVSRKSSMTPFGVIDQFTTDSENLTNDVTVIPAPTPEIQAIDDYLPVISIPDTGIWVRVYYPGSFSGTLGGRGILTTVKSTGDQLYNIPANVGIVEGSIEKDDASAGKMVVEVYKDGVRMSQTATTIPHGLIDIHTTV
ncbi:MAG: hypothetical protein CVV30_01195 [Methanomicrobiales archaeon HGW-Methanomicrobiales-1]|jgi:hypothetical protein|nr:MAG: hypothetical protein CVV30_01195 [Methanomicrobiales archaeon HGW-Methanomicrobiales-1]